ncbi:MAG TPA: hypothetical protein VGG62_03620 [Terracidiphilus sp.]|jgi:hypothetical protein
MSEKNGRYHTYHAEAGVLHARLQLPLVQEIKPQAFTKLPERGGYLSQHAHDYRLEGVVSFRSAYTQVAGNHDVKPGHGFSTVATSVIEDLNVLDVVTADRVVAQISTEHPLAGYVPHISFLGTRFENLRIAGHKVDFDLDCDFLGPRPEDDSAYTGNHELMKKIAAQSKHAEGFEAFSDDVFDGYYQDLAKAGDPDVENPDYEESLECSLVNNARLDQADDSYPGKCFNHVIDVPNFGKIHLATLRVNHRQFQKGTGVPKQTTVDLSMVKMKLGCFAAGTAAMVGTRTNGSSHP